MGSLAWKIGFGQKTLGAIAYSLSFGISACGNWTAAAGGTSWLDRELLKILNENHIREPHLAIESTDTGELPLGSHGILSKLGILGVAPSLKHMSSIGCVSQRRFYSWSQFLLPTALRWPPVQQTCIRYQRYRTTATDSNDDIQIRTKKTAHLGWCQVGVEVFVWTVGQCGAGESKTEERKTLH